MTTKRTFSKRDGSMTFTADAYSYNGKIWRWCSNDAPVPLDAAKEYGVPVDVECQRQALDQHYTETIAAYRKSQSRMSAADKAEQRMEARAAHGPGVKLVNVFTGESYTT